MSSSGRSRTPSSSSSSSVRRSVLLNTQRSSSSSNNNNNSRTPVDLTKPVPSSPQPVIPPGKIVANIAEAGTKFQSVSEMCGEVSAVLSLRGKRKNIEEYLANIENPPDEFGKLAHGMNEINAHAIAGKPIDPAKAGELYSNVARALEKTSLLVPPSSSSKQSPLSSSELGALYNVCKKHPQARPKKLRPADENELSDSLNKELHKMMPQLSRIEKLSAELATLISELPRFSSPEFVQLRETFVSHMKGVMKDLTDIQVDQAMYNNTVRNRVDEAKAWYEKKLRAIQIIVTICVCQHRLSQTETVLPEDLEDFKRILDLAQEAYKTNEVDKEIASLCPANSLEIAQSPHLPTYLPFYHSFALQPGTGDYSLLFGKIPVTPVKVEGQTTARILSSLNSRPTINPHIYKPKIICFLRDGESYTLVFEYVPTLPQGRLLQLAPKISEEHRKSMYCGFADLMENLARAQRIPMMETTSIQFTRGCQVMLNPVEYGRMVILRNKESPLESPLANHPDTVLQPNFSLVYVGWLIEMLEFQTMPTGDLKTIMNSQNKNTFSAIMKQILAKLYLPNDGSCTRPINAVSGLINSTAHPKTGPCVFSCRYSDPAHIKEFLRTCTAEFKEYYPEDGGGGVDVGRLDRRDGHYTRLKQIVKAVNRASSEDLTWIWKYELDGEAAPGHVTTLGVGPFKGIVRDFFEQILKHRIFQIINGKMVLAASNTQCESCSVPGHSRQCNLFGSKEIYEAIGRVCQTAIVAGVQIPKAMSLMLAHQLLGQTESANMEMCLDLFPNIVKLLDSTTERFGPVTLDKEGEFTAKELFMIKTTFDLPNIVDLSVCFPHLATKNCVTIPTVPFYLMESLQDHLDKTLDFAKYIRNGMTTGTFGKLLSTASPVFLIECLGQPSSWVEPELLFSKINFGLGFGPDKVTIFKRVMRESNDFRIAFMMSLNDTTNIPQSLRDNSIELTTVTPEENRANLASRASASDRRALMNSFGGVEVHVCSREVKFPFFTNEEQLRTIVSCLGNGAGTGSDLYNDT